ncbi:MAG: hypothetical protein AB1465_05960 [Patescibacteria group bacterium]
MTKTTAGHANVMVIHAIATVRAMPVILVRVVLAGHEVMMTR